MHLNYYCVPEIELGNHIYSAAMEVNEIAERQETGRWQGNPPFLIGPASRITRPFSVSLRG